jgi:hypothetical protein
LSFELYLAGINQLHIQELGGLKAISAVVEGTKKSPM